MMSDYDVLLRYLINGKKYAGIASYCSLNQSSMFIGKEKINWVSECKYLEEKECNRIYCHTTCENNRREFCGAVNSIYYLLIILSNHLPEECMVCLNMLC